FGWKAQNKSLLIFAGEAYNVEQGVTNELFPNERDPNCQYNGLPEDRTNMAPILNGVSDASDYASDTVNFAAFMRLSAPPAAVPPPRRCRPPQRVVLLRPRAGNRFSRASGVTPATS